MPSLIYCGLWEEHLSSAYLFVLIVLSLRLESFRALFLCDSYNANDWIFIILKAVFFRDERKAKRREICRRVAT